MGMHVIIGITEQGPMVGLILKGRGLVKDQTLVRL
jgi:hypothetical protein